MQNAVAQMRLNLNTSEGHIDSETSGPRFEYNIVGVQKTSEKIKRSTNNSSSNNVGQR